jgi:hypothetical protein
VNAAVLLFSACLAGADPVAAPAAPAAPAVVYVQNNNDCCGKASVSGDCCDKADKCCLLQKLKKKLFFWKNCDLCDKGNKCDNGNANKCDKGHGNKGCNFCDKGCNFCDKGKGNKGCDQQQVAVVKQQDCGKQDDCGKKDCCLKGFLHSKKDCFNKDVCGKAEVNKCDDNGDKCCWKPGYFLHKCKAKLCGLCDKKEACCGGCGTAATPNGCGTTVITPPAQAVPVKPVSPAKIPDKVGSAYPAVRDLTPAGGSPRTIDLTPDSN